MKYREVRNKYSILFVKPEGRRTLERFRRKWEGSIETYI
jgi:hypothetical protein